MRSLTNNNTIHQSRPCKSDIPSPTLNRSRFLRCPGVLEQSARSGSRNNAGTVSGDVGAEIAEVGFDADLRAVLGDVCLHSGVGGVVGELDADGALHEIVVVWELESAR